MTLNAVFKEHVNFGYAGGQSQVKTLLVGKTYVFTASWHGPILARNAVVPHSRPMPQSGFQPGQCCQKGCDFPKKRCKRGHSMKRRNGRFAFMVF